MCLSRPKAPPPVVQARPAPTTSSTSAGPEFDTGTPTVDTQSTVNNKNKRGKDKLKNSKTTDPSLSITGSTESGVSMNP